MPFLPTCRAASGVVRRHPDAKWLRRDSDIASFASTQHRILNALWPLLRPGGEFLYATCSLFPAENQAQIASFLHRHHDAERLHEQIFPQAAHDGFLPAAQTDLSDVPPSHSGYPLLCWLWLFCCPPVQAAEIGVNDPRLEWSDDGYVLSADFNFDLNPRLEDAVNRGLMLTFVADFQLERERWYWLDEKNCPTQPDLPPFLSRTDPPIPPEPGRPASKLRQPECCPGRPAPPPQLAGDRAQGR